MSKSASTQGKFADVPIRVRSWLYIILVFGIAISSSITMYIFTAWLCFQGLKEFKKMFNFKPSFWVLIVGLSVAQLSLLYFFNDYYEYIIYALIITFLAILSGIFTQEKSRKKMSAIASAVLICFLSFGHLSFIRNYFDAYIDDAFLGIKLIVFLIVLTELNDVFQYLSGKFFGKRKIVPEISPNKTVEGFLGALVLTVLLSTILGYFLLPFSWITLSFIGLLLGITGFFGDVLMSFIKRKANIKDTGKLLPGHGGLLDRMDSLIFNAPLFYFLIEYLLR